MINQSDYYEKWIEYSNRYNDYMGFIELKTKHMAEVHRIINALSSELGFDDRMKKLAGITGLYHDIGRYEQYKRYNTYMDKESVDHGDFSAEIILEEKLLDELNEGDIKIVLAAIRNHNKMHIEDGLGEDALMLAKLVRDADTIDILRVVCEEPFETSHLSTAEELETFAINDNVYRSVKEHRNVKKAECDNNLESIICCAAYVFGLNFCQSINMVRDGKYYLCKLDTLKMKKPESKERLDDILSEIKSYIEQDR